MKEQALPLYSHLSLPAGFRPRDAAALHARDARKLAEKVEEGSDGLTVAKGLCWQGRPALLQLRMQAGQAWASLQVDAPWDLAVGKDAQQMAFDAMVRRLLGLSAGVGPFERRHAGHPELGPLLRRQAGLRVPGSATPFEALVWAITGQQISVSAATALRRRLIEAIHVRHGSGMLCFPDAAALAALAPRQLREAGFSLSKTEALGRVCAAVNEGSLPLDDWARQPLTQAQAGQVEKALLAIKGIGPWTVNYVLLRGYGWLDGSLHGDVAVRNALARLLARPGVSQAEAAQWLAGFAPWRALVAAHLWASLADGAY